MRAEQAVAFVTGTNRGIGLQFVRALKARGASKIYAASRTGETSEEGVIPVKLDITNPEEVAAAAALAQDVTLLVNNAGINLYAPFLNPRSEEHARHEMEVNYFGTLAMCRAFAPILGANGGGAIVNMVSILSRVNMPAMGSLCASKAALLSLTQGVRAQLAGQGTFVLGVMPGAVDTDMSRGLQVPLVDPADVATQALDAVENGVEDLYLGDMAQGIYQGLLHDPKGTERQFAQYLPQ